MEPPFKKRRLSGSSHPEIDLHARRAQNDLRLKSIFESIFEKYGRNFDGIGDEIDMETGEIVVNNGHIQGMTSERDAGEIVVNNGHVQGMTSERDAEDAEYSSRELGNFDGEDDHSSIEYGMEPWAALESLEAGNAAAREGSEESELSDFDADSLMGEVPCESHLHQLSVKSRRVVPIPSDDDEDELASSDIEWASHNKDRLSAQERWCLLKDRAAFRDGPATEQAWRSPPLPNIALLKRERQQVGLADVDDLREYSDDERAGISLWAPEAKKTRRRRRESSNSINQPALSFARGQENSADEQLSDSSLSEPATRKILKWTREEEELLIHLKTTKHLSGAAIQSYFPERHGNTVGSHWTYMVTRGKVSGKPQVPAMLGRRTSLPKVSRSETPLASDRIRPQQCNHDTLWRPKEPQSVQQHSNGGILESEGLVRSSSNPTQQIGDRHTNAQNRIRGTHGTSNGYAVDESSLTSDDAGAHIGYTINEPFPSTRDHETRHSLRGNDSRNDSRELVARTSDHHNSIEKVHGGSEQSSSRRDQEVTRRTKRTDSPETSANRTSDTSHQMDVGRKANADDSHLGTDQSYNLKPLEIEDVTRRKTGFASTRSDHGLEVVSENGCGAWASSLTTPVNFEPDWEGAEPYKDGIVPSELQPGCATAIQTSNSPREFKISHSTLQRAESLLPTAEDVIQRRRSTKEGTQKTKSKMDVVSIGAAQSPDHEKSSELCEHNIETTRRSLSKRQVVQVVIPLAATSNLMKKRGDHRESPSSHSHNRKPLATTETEDPAVLRKNYIAAKSVPADLGPNSSHQENPAIRTTTRSPSMTAAESQYAASAALVFNDVRSCLGPEIADSQPLNAAPVIGTPAPELGGDASRPIILDVESPPSQMTPGVAFSARKQPKEATKTTILGSGSQPSRLTPGTVTPSRKRIEEAIESDIVESGFHLPSKTLSASRLPSKKLQQNIIAQSFSSMWTAIDDCSEDELSYL